MAFDYFDRWYGGKYFGHRFACWGCFDGDCEQALYIYDPFEMGTSGAARIFRFNCHAYLVEFQSLLNYFLVLGFLILHRAVNLLEIDTFHNWVSVLNMSCKVTEDDVWAVTELEFECRLPILVFSTTRRHGL